MGKHSKKIKERKNKREKSVILRKSEKKREFDYIFRLMASPKIMPCKYKDVKVDFAPVQMYLMQDI